MINQKKERKELKRMEEKQRMKKKKKENKEKNNKIKLCSKSKGRPTHSLPNIYKTPVTQTSSPFHFKCNHV